MLLSIIVWTLLLCLQASNDWKVVGDVDIFVCHIVQRVQTLGVEDIVDTQQTVHWTEGVAIASALLNKGIDEVAAKLVIDIRHRCVVEVATYDMLIRGIVDNHTKCIDVYGTN